ncbi:uncharacterized protein LOC105276642 isoform X3 [Ooceraea biroi]|uniref:uncharacterized protein LOC105276642 isoform X3 n=1 Tax=Ooceraea biroi TaxID=2015173 RepID=UPI000F07A602|nr:uncharacterized protein LOC105276642 isoform X3 [Ooceraea biroi]
MQIAVSAATETAKSVPEKIEQEREQGTEAAVSFVLQLDVEATTAAPVAEKEEKTSIGNEKQRPVPTLLFARDIWTPESVTVAATDSDTATSGNTMVITNSGDINAAVPITGSKLQLSQCMELTSNYRQIVSTASALPTVKSMVTYPVAKGTKEQMQKMIAGSQTNTTQVLTTRVISQKLPSPSSSQAQPVPITAFSMSSPQTSLSSSGNGGITYPLQTTICTLQSGQSAKNQDSAIGELFHGKRQQQATATSNVQSTLHKLQPIPVQQHMINTAATVKTITTAPTVSNLQRIHVKAASPSIVAAGQSAQTVNLQKVKTTMTNLSSNQPVGIVQRNNSLSKIQSVQKSLTGQINQLSVNNQTTTNNVNNSQKIQQSNPMMLQKTTQSIPATLQSVCSQKVPSLNSNHKSNHKTQQQNLQKLQGAQKTLVITKQQQQLAAQQMNNISKSNGPVTNVQKTQTIGQQPSTSQQMQPSHQRQSATAVLQKSQTLTTMQSAKRIQSATSNVCKSNSVPNISNKIIPQNSNVLTINKQQQITSQQQQQQQQQLQSAQQQPVIQKSQNVNNLQVQRSHSITNVHQKNITSMPNNQRLQSVMNSKVQQQQQQQMMMRVGISKGGLTQAPQNTVALGVPQKLVNTVKTASSNSQSDTVQQSVQRNSNPAQAVKTIQQQQQPQNEIGQLNAPQKQLGCIKTIPPQKPVQRNHVQKASGIKTSMNTNTTLMKTQSSVIVPQVTPQKTIIKTLLPQQTPAVATAAASSSIMVAHKTSPIKIQQQQIQQKQLFMTPQYTQQIRQQTGQIKTLLPVTPIELRKDLVENKNDVELQMAKEEEPGVPKSPVRRMPLPYECLQFVLQDHNYGAPPPRTPSPSSPPSHPKQQTINGAGSSTTTLQHPYIFGPVVSNTNAEDDAASAISSEAGREAEPEGEETETAPEGEGDDEDSVTRCICDFEHDDGYMICCDRCLVWQHVDCMGIDRSNIPDEYLCERCRPRRVDRQRARALQMRKREELLNSDTSSDTSSTSSADTDVGVNNIATQKKRSLSQQQSQVPRRNKSDMGSVQTAQVRKLNNNNNVAKRQRKDSHARQSSAVRKKENAAPKRGPGKRKTKRRMSVEDKEEDVQDAWSSNMAPLRQWIEKYEEAVTNHYSPELRARISSIKVNGTHSDLRQANMSVIATGKCRLNVHSNNLKFLVATMYLSPNTPVVELRGKYMLSTQHRPQHPQGSRQHVQRPGPFVFFYRLPRDGTEVCVDTRTYGNDARFVRRSCKPNAEVKHCIEKGTLHLYIVTTCAIEKNAEITIKHEQHDLLLSPNLNSPTLPVVCACNNPRECQIAAANQLNRRSSNGALIENADGRERRRRGRRNTTCEETESTSPVVSTSVTQTVTTATPVSTVTTVTPKKTVTTTITTTMARQVPKEEATAVVQPNVQPQTSLSLSQPTVVTLETKKDKKKMTREERKMEAIMKAFERLEKAEQRKQEVQARNAQRKESSGTHSDNEDSHPTTTGQSKGGKQTNNSERPLRRKRRKGRARTTSSSQSQSNTNRRTRLNSADSDVSSGDESNSVQSPPLLNQKRPSSRDVSYSHLQASVKNATSSDGTSDNIGSSSGNQRIPTAAGLLLALANSNAPGPPSSPPLLQPTPVKSPTCDSGASSSSQSSTPSTPLSSTCLLVAAAVGPLAPGFKFPKTKKVLMNEWLKESPDPPQAVPQVSPVPALSSTPILPNSMNSISLCGRSADFPSLSTTDPSVEFLSQSYAAKSLATLVQAANSVGGICDSPPQHKQQQQHQAIAVSSNNNNNNNNSGCIAVSTGSAKKRWLRQAISEECESPNSRPESPPLLSEKVAPPKKRRIARESLSSENYTPPTTPTMLLSSEAVPNSRSLCPTEDDYMENAQSPVVEQNDEKPYESEFAKEEINVDGERMDSNELVAREKLSINIPQSDFYIKRKKKREHLDNVKTEVSFVVETENVTMNDEVSPKCENKQEAELNFSPLQMDSKIFAKIREVVESKIDFGLNDSDFSTNKESSTKKQATEGTVEIIDQDKPNIEMEELSSPSAIMESDTILKQRVAEMQLEFGGGINEVVNVANSEDEKSGDNKKVSEIATRCREIVERSDDNISIDEFDVEAQMKKITGDDGNDYEEQIDTSLEKDKSIDGIEGLMESSKEDSDSEDKDMDDEKYCESSFKLFSVNHEKTLVKESELTKPEQITVALEDNVKDTNKNTSDEPLKEISKMEESFIFATLSEESIFEAASSNMDVKPVVNSPKIFHSIAPLSERIRKKPDPAATPKMPKMDFEAAIIESTINMDTADESKNGEQKLILSTALRELLEAKLDDVPSTATATVEVMKNDIDNEINMPSQVIKPISDSSERSLDSTTVQDSTMTRQESLPIPVKEEEVQPKEVKRLKDPRTVVPNNMPAPPTVKPDAVPPAKRKVRKVHHN